jgi:hypothetical protein
VRSQIAHENKLLYYIFIVQTYFLKIHIYKYASIREHVCVCVCVCVCIHKNILIGLEGNAPNCQLWLTLRGMWDGSGRGFFHIVLYIHLNCFYNVHVLLGF